ncbi:MULTISPECIES: signal recognition particle-docking protein FtsY [unclassified Xanthobacter]|uniref:signal recognition particle-docking protein FtsY n=1 Tax=unclassified Xanthobacter TaxID=2623496 RepID=UPI001EDDE5A8|nr:MULTISPECIES: signal recognition particle-docking protein FtsY [unclassified Xanthobacter]
MSQDDPRDDAAKDAATNDAPAKEIPAKKKRGFWGWLTGGSETEAAPAAEPAPTEPASEAHTETQDGASLDAVSPDRPPEAAAHQETASQEAVSQEAVSQEAVSQEVVREDASSEDAPSADAPALPAEPVAAAPEPLPVAEVPAQAPVEVVAEAITSVAVVSEGEAPIEAPLEGPVEMAVSAVLPEPVPPEAEPVASALEALAPVVPEATAPTEPEVPVSDTAEPQAPAPVAAAEEPELVAEGGAGDEAGALVPATPAKKGFWARLASGLARTASNLGQGITDLVSKRKLDDDTLEELEDVLIRADLGVETATRIVEAVGKGRHDKMISPEEVKGLIADEVEAILTPVAKPLVIDHKHRPFVVLMVGVNGSGKTTTIGKLAAQWRHEGKKVMLAAGDTFRAAAIDQLKVWGARTGTKVIAREPGADAAGVAHEALTEARAEGADILLIDTAGRLQNRTELMAELEKIVRVVKKLEPSAPHAVLLVLDATVGQNALSQVEAFRRIAGVTGLVMTKLDGTARGGILVAIAAKHQLPVHLIGVGEAAEDLQPFTARDFARAIAGLD